MSEVKFQHIGHVNDVQENIGKFLGFARVGIRSVTHKFFALS